MPLYRPNADDQLRGDFLICTTTSDQAQDFDFPFAQRFDPWLPLNDLFLRGWQLG